MVDARLWADANQLTVEIMNGNNDVAFAGSDWRKPTFLANLKSYWDLSANTYIQVDLTGLHGVTDHDGDLDHDFLALDIVYDWYPLGRELYRGFPARGMLLRSWLDLEEGGSLNTWGCYLYGQYKLLPAGLAECAGTGSRTSEQAGHELWGLSPYLSFWQSEFVRLRGQYSTETTTVTGPTIDSSCSSPLRPGPTSTRNTEVIVMKKALDFGPHHGGDAHHAIA